MEVDATSPPSARLLFWNQSDAFRSTCIQCISWSCFPRKCEQVKSMIPHSEAAQLHLDIFLLYFSTTAKILKGRRQFLGVTRGKVCRWRMQASQAEARGHGGRLVLQADAASLSRWPLVRTYIGDPSIQFPPTIYRKTDFMFWQARVDHLCRNTTAPTARLRGPGRDATFFVFSTLAMLHSCDLQSANWQADDLLEQICQTRRRWTRSASLMSRLLAALWNETGYDGYRAGPCSVDSDSINNRSEAGSKVHEAAWRICPANSAGSVPDARNREPKGLLRAWW